MARARRYEVMTRAKGLCEYCKYPDAFSPGPFAVEHIIPLSAYGSFELENLAWACDGCNGHKAAATEATDIVTGKSVPLFHPRIDRWSEHFAWTADGLLIIGITPTGRATVDRLQLNRGELVNARRLFRTTPLDVRQ